MSSNLFFFESLRALEGFLYAICLFGLNDIMMQALSFVGSFGSFLSVACPVAIACLMITVDKPEQMNTDV